MSQHFVIARKFILAAVISISAPGCALSTEVPTSPALATTVNGVCRPKLKVDADTYEAGTAFLLTSVRPLLLTAHHLFGPDGGLAKPISWQDMPTRAHIISCRSIGTGPPVSGETAIAVSGAHAMNPADQSGAINDVAVFRTPPESSMASSLMLAVSPAREGDRVWLIAEVEGSHSLLHPARVLGSQDGALVFAYDNPRLVLQATSGAPIVNADGKVVGLNLGGGYDAEAKTVVGVADDLAVLVKAVAAAGDR